jgi:hypothetical protein
MERCVIERSLCPASPWIAPTLWGAQIRMRKIAGAFDPGGVVLLSVCYVALQRVLQLILLRFRSRDVNP